MSKLASLTRKLTALACNIHSVALVRVLDKAVLAEQRATDAVENSERLSRWANEQKQLTRQQLKQATQQADAVHVAVNDELGRLPFIGRWS